MADMEPSGELIDGWRRQALSDLRNARRNAEMGAHDVCVLLCQQAAEKMLKAAYMTVKGEEAPFTHNLAALLRALGAALPLLEDSTALTTDYIMSRYPPLPGQIPAEAYAAPESADRLARAERIVRWAEEVAADASGEPA